MSDYAISGSGQSAEIDTAAIQRLDAAHYLHPFTDHKSLAAKGTRVITRGDFPLELV